MNISAAVNIFYAPVYVHQLIDSIHAIQMTGPIDVSKVLTSVFVVTGVTAQKFHPGFGTSFRQIELSHYLKLLNLTKQLSAPFE
jgi:hypothetical protein